MLGIRDMHAILQDVECGAWEIYLGGGGMAEHHIYLQVTQVAMCNVAGDAYQVRGRKWRLSRHMTRSEVVQTALKAILTAEEHEVRERFKYRGRSIFDPHYDVDQLWALRGEGEQALDVRDEPVHDHDQVVDKHIEDKKKDPWYWRRGAGQLS